MKIYEASIDMSCELQVEAENAKRAHEIINEHLDLITSKTKDKEEFIEVTDWNIDDIAMRVDDDGDTGEEWLICSHCNGEGTKCTWCQGRGEVTA